MAQRITAEEFLALRDSGLTIIDVRSPLEYEDSHIPGALNIPLFSDEEREIVGTRYKQISKDSAMLAGLEFAGRKLAWYVKKLQKISKEKHVLMYCWRGGMRSAALAWLFEFSGYQISLLDGGYKAYRNYLQDEFARDAHLFILGGMTGSGKTEILEELERQGQQIIHLEKEAHHKGSAFGALGQANQPTPTQFENELFEYWRNLDLSRPVFIEDESIGIGKVFVPQALFTQMRTKTLLLLTIPTEDRIKRILAEYAGFSDEELKSSFIKIGKRLGPENLSKALQCIDNKQHAEAIRISLLYYDKAYQKGNSRRDSNQTIPISFPGDSPAENAKKIIFLVYNELSK